jgi:vancomycin resistance protein YoaR
VLVPVLLALAVVVGWLVDGVLLGGSESARNLTLDDVPVGGLTESEVETAVLGIAARRAETPVTVRSGTDGSDADEVVTTAADIGLTVDVEATVDDAMDAGGGANPVDWLLGFWRDPSAELSWTLDRDRAAAAVASLADSAPGSVALLELRDGVLVAAPDGPVLAVDLDRLEDDLLEQAAALPQGPEAAIDVTAAMVPVEGGTDPGEAGDLAEVANAVTEAGITAVVDGAESLLDKDDLRPLVRLVEVESDDPETTLALALDPVGTEELLRERFGAAEREGTDATFVVAFGLVGIEGGDPDVRCCDPAAAETILDALLDGEERVDIPLVQTPRPQGREWAESLGITELVGSFTTRFTPGQARVRNIERISELTRGVIIPAGETFSVNEFVGRRTAENGFVSAGVIESGVFSESVGGGISQYATTLFNAAFFGGLDFGEYQSHSIYIDRYPYGREATLSYPSPDLQIRNTTPYAVLLWPTTTANSITVELFSTRYAAGEQTGQSEEQVGVACTRVTTQRTRTFVDGRAPVVDSVRALYRPEGVRCDGSPSVATTAPPPIFIPPTTPPPTTTPTTTAPPVTTTTAPPPPPPPPDTTPATAPPA